MGLHGRGVFGFSSANCEGAKRIKCPNCKAIFYWGSHNRHTFYPEDNTVYCPENNKIQSLHKGSTEGKQE